MSTDDLLREYLTESKRDLEDQRIASIVKSTFPNTPASDLANVVGKLALVLPLYLARKNVDLLGEPATPSVLAAYAGIDLGGTNLASAVRALVQDPQLMEPIQWRLPDPVDLIGYDPRLPFDSGDRETEGTIQGYYAKLLGEASKATELAYNRIRLKRDYAAAKAAIYRDFHDRSTRYDLLVVDFAWLPELAYQGHIVPLDTFFPGIAEQFHSSILACCTKHGKPAQTSFWLRALLHLARGGNRYHYAFPLFVNLHGRLVPEGEEGRIPKSLPEPDIAQIRDLQESSLQSELSSCAVYELYAHFAYRNAIPIVPDDQSAAAGSDFGVTRISFKTDNSRDAIADYLTRVVLATKKPTDPAFDKDHGSEVHRLSNGLTKCGVAFNSELLGQLSDVGSFKWMWPLCNPNTNRYLTSLGGYGLAISRQALDGSTAFRFALKAFRESGRKGDLIPEAVVKDCPNIDGTLSDQWLNCHCRPRIPFWSQVEEIIGCALLQLYGLPGIGDASRSTGPEQIRARIRTTMGEAEATNVLDALQERLRRMFTSNGWSVRRVE